MPDIHVRLRNDILWLLLDRQPLNPLTTEMLRTLSLALQRAKEQSPRLIVITGMGEQAFCAGIDISNNSEEQHIELLHAAKNTEMAFDALSPHDIATVALIKGNAFGPGYELASLCDTVIARDDATFRLPTLNTKVFPSVVSLRLPSTIGHETTNRLIQNNETLNAYEALRLGLIHQVVPARRFLLDTEELLVMLAAVGKTL